MSVVEWERDNEKNGSIIRSKNHPLTTTTATTTTKQREENREKNKQIKIMHKKLFIQQFQCEILFYDVYSFIFMDDQRHTMVRVCVCVVAFYANMPLTHYDTTSFSHKFHPIPHSNSLTEREREAECERERGPIQWLSHTPQSTTHHTYARACRFEHKQTFNRTAYAFGINEFL